MLDLKPGSNKSVLENTMNGHILLEGEAMATKADENEVPICLIYISSGIDRHSHDLV